MKYEDLDDDAKAKAREWWKQTESEMWGSDRAPDYYDDFITTLAMLGFEVDTKARTVRYMNGTERTTQEPEFYWSGFWCQGDGFVFAARWKAEDVRLDRLMDEWPKDEVLHRIGAQMMVLVLRWPTLTANITTVSSGPGLPYMQVGFDDDDTVPADDERTLKELAKDLANWCYRQLEANYEYDCGDEAAKEAIEANEYEFDEDGAYA